jgi:hypothetical protein
MTQKKGAIAPFMFEALVVSTTVAPRQQYHY